MGNRVVYKGVTFSTIRWALFNMYFWRPEMTQDEIDAYAGYILPMQHNITNPLQGDGAKDTFIEYWIARDYVITSDFNDTTVEGGENSVWKMAQVDLRFVGVEAETWAKAFHHIKKREDVYNAFFELCEGEILEGIGEIIPAAIDYFGQGNASIAFDLHIKIKYKESIVLSWEPLGYISVASGEVSGGTSVV